MNNPVILQSSKEFSKINEFVNANPSENISSLNDDDFKHYLRVYADYIALSNKGIPQIVVDEMIKRKITPPQFMH